MTLTLMPYISRWFNLNKVDFTNILVLIFDLKIDTF